MTPEQIEEYRRLLAHLDDPEEYDRIMGKWEGERQRLIHEAAYRHALASGLDAA